MFNLVRNELAKLFAQKKMFVFFCIVLAFLLMISVATYVSREHREAAGVVTETNGQIFAIGMVEPIGQFIVFFMIILIADMFTDEYIQGTLKLPLLYPITRRQYLAGKVLALYAAITIIYLFTMVASYGIGIVFEGWGNQFEFAGKVLSPVPGIFVTLAAYLIAVIPLFAFGMVILFFAIILSSAGSVNGIGVGLFFGMTLFGQVYAPIRPYLITSYFNIFPQIFLGMWKETLIALAVILLYGGISYLLSMQIFTRKDLLH